jgi:hypothetical protein
VIRRALLAAALALAAGSPPAAGALRVGIAEQQPSAFADPRLRALNLKVARMVVPWNDFSGVQAWLDATRAAGMTPHVAFNCSTASCRAPSRREYAAAVRRFRARFPTVRTFTTWNEANHANQPTASRPELVAGYYAALRAACARCTVVAGDVVDSGTFIRWLRRFRAASHLRPRLWGLHNYADVTYGTTSGTDATLAAVPGTLWIEETGGIVIRRDTRGRELLASDEARATRAVTRSIRLARARSRIARVYVYQWRAEPWSTFDSGLVRPDGSARPSLAALRAELRTLRRLRSTSTTWTAHRTGRTLRLRVRCGARRCRGKVTVALRAARTYRSRWTTRRVTVRRYRVRRAGSIRVRIGRLRPAARRRLVLTVRSTAPRTARQRFVLKLR